MGKFDCTRQYYRCNMTLSVTMFLGLMLALMFSGKPKTYLIETVDNADILEEAKPKISRSHGNDYCGLTIDTKGFGFQLMGQEGYKLKPGLTPLQQCKRFLKAVVQGSTRPGYNCSSCDTNGYDDDVYLSCGSEKRLPIPGYNYGPYLYFSRNNVEVTFSDCII